MASRSLRYGVRREIDLSSATWTVATPKNVKSDVYLFCRPLRGTLKASMHESGRWHVAFSPEVYKKESNSAAATLKDRFIEKWPRPREIGKGCTLAFKIVIPHWAVTSPINDKEAAKITWIANAPRTKATEIYVLLTHGGSSSSEWPAKRSMGTKLIGTLAMNNGETLWVVYREVDMPDIPESINISPHYFKGQNKSDIRPGSKVLMFGIDPDGSRVIFDLTIKSVSGKGNLPELIYATFKGILSKSIDILRRVQRW